jgi:hypothetical protein
MPLSSSRTWHQRSTAIHRLHRTLCHRPLARVWSIREADRVGLAHSYSFVVAVLHANPSQIEPSALGSTNAVVLVPN